MTITNLIAWFLATAGIMFFLLVAWTARHFWKMIRDLLRF